MDGEAIISLSSPAPKLWGGCEVLARVRMIEGVRCIEKEAENLDKDHILRDKKFGSSTYR